MILDTYFLQFTLYEISSGDTMNLSQNDLRAVGMVSAEQLYHPYDAATGGIR
jgi:hypothetical protein